MISMQKSGATGKIEDPAHVNHTANLSSRPFYPGFDRENDKSCVYIIAWKILFT